MATAQQDAELAHPWLGRNYQVNGSDRILRERPQHAGDVTSPMRSLQERLIRDRDHDWTWSGRLAGIKPRPWPETVEELRGSEDFWEIGSCTILDIKQVVHTPAAPGFGSSYGGLFSVRPLAPERLRRYFTTEEPSPAQFDAAIDGRNPLYEESWHEDYVRWTGHYLLLYEGAAPTEVGFWGWSGDCTCASVRRAEQTDLRLLKVAT
jgi:hypothetical protein